MNADFRGRKLTHTGCESRGLASDREIVPPWNRWAFFIQGGFAQDRIVRPLVEAHDEAVSVHFEQAIGFHKLAIELFGLRFVEPTIHVKRDTQLSIAYSEELISSTISATLQSTDRQHGMVGQARGHFQRDA